jgi:hypothetical protein
MIYVQALYRGAGISLEGGRLRAANLMPPISVSMISKSRDSRIDGVSLAMTKSRRRSSAPSRLMNRSIHLAMLRGSWAPLAIGFLVIAVAESVWLYFKIRR